MKDLKFLLFLIAGYLIVFVESIDIQNVIYDLYYSIMGLINPSHVMPEIVKQVLFLGVSIITFLLLLKTFTLGK